MKKELELYVHIPFCVRKCAYCDFLSFPARDKEIAVYVEALVREIKGKKEKFSDYCVTTIFLGGGTPSLLKGADTASVFRAIYENFDIAKDAEITMEVNPGTASEEKISTWKECGVNRLSIGLQSVNDEELKMLGRIHTYDEFLSTWLHVRKAGFKNVNIDLISAIPGQTKASWEKTLRTVAALNPEHISAYSLIIEEGTMFDKIYGEYPDATYGGNLPLPDEDTERAIYEATQVILQEYGYERYEISNYAKSGYECSHNLGYWERREYLGLGLGASSLIDESRFSNPNQMSIYLEINGLYSIKEKNEQRKQQLKWQSTEWLEQQGADSIQKLSIQEQMEEFLFLGLRKTEGICEQRFFEAFGVPIDSVYAKTLRKLERERLILRENGMVRLTERGIDISNYVMSEFLFP